MCGRYAITLPPEAVRGFFRYVEQPNFPPRYNVAPTQPVPIVRLERDKDGTLHRHFVLVRWGFLPGFVKDVKKFPLIINARAEGIGEKASFRAALRRRRCLFIADAFYEWRREGEPKGQAKPFMIRRADGKPFGLAGLWEHYVGADGSEIETGCIITVTASGQMSAVHDRMPAVIEEKDFNTWLDPDEAKSGAALSLLRPAAEGSLVLTPIGRAVNKVSNDGPELQAPA
jgi:putative SOS response-associated peptidase YedK